MIADLLDSIVRVVIEDGIRTVGLVVLKATTLGRYRSGGPSARLVEGTIGLAAIAAACVVVLTWL